MKRIHRLLSLFFALILLFSFAKADYTILSLPSGENAFFSTLLGEDHLMVQTSRKFYQYDLHTGDCKKLADSPSGCIGGFVGNDNSCWCFGNGDDNQIYIDLLNQEANAWERVWTIRSENNENDIVNITSAVCKDNIVYMACYRYNQPHLLAALDLSTSILNPIGSIGFQEGDGSRLIIANDTVLFIARDEMAVETYVFSYDISSKTLEKNKIELERTTTIHDFDFNEASCQFWVMEYDGLTRKNNIMTGKDLDHLEFAADIQSFAGSLVATKDGCLYSDGTQLIDYRVLQTATSSICIANFTTQYDGKFMVDSGINVTKSDCSFSDMINHKDSSIDIIAIPTDGATSLKTIKKKKYYTDLSGNTDLLAAANRMYPCLQNVVMDGSHLMGWILSVEPFTFSADEYLLSQYGLQVPQSVPELLDQIRYLDEEGVFETGEYIPFDTIWYDRQSMLEYTVKRFIFEQEKQQKRLNFDNQALKNVLLQIIQDVPAVTPYPGGTGEESPVYQLSSVYDPISKYMKLPVQISDASPQAIQTRVQVLIVNPYSKHKEEAFRYLNYLQMQQQPMDFLCYQDEIAPMKNPRVEDEIMELDDKIAEFGQPTENCSCAPLAEEYKARLEELKKNLYLVDDEDIAVWHKMAGNMVVLEESLYTEDLMNLVGKLANQILSVDEFVRQCNRYVGMVYAEQ